MHTSHVYLLETTVITCLMTFVQYGGIAAAAHRLDEPRVLHARWCSGVWTL